MFSADLLINRIATVTGYPTELALSINDDTQEPNTLPRVYVGYADITRVPQVPVNMDFLSAHGEDLVQIFEVKLIANVSNFVVNWQRVYQSLIDYTPTLAAGSTASSTNFAFIHTSIHSANGKMISVSKWGVGFPSSNVIV